mmetsp:Transcript_29932/g.95642  ORF Transcript_29932/g.95642 Transcript_29932/m.95642 type:complete len:347 (-) Transcript_29932:4443-5483(-)
MRHRGIEDGVDAPDQVLGHDDFALDRLLHELQRLPDDVDDDLETLRLLEQEDVERDAQSALPINDLERQVLDVVHRDRFEQALGLLLHNLFPRWPVAGRARLRLRLDDHREELRGLLHAEREVRVGVQPEDLRGINLREPRNASVVVLELAGRDDVVAVVEGRARDGLLGVELELLRQRRRRQPGLCVGLEEPPVEVVRNLAAVLRLCHHVLKRGPAQRTSVQVLLQEVDARLQISIVELVRDAPSQRTELPPLLDDGVREAQRVEQLLPLVRLDALEPILVHDNGVGTEHAGAQALGRLVRDLRARLQQRDGELRVRLRGEEEPEVGVQVLLDLLKEVLHGIHEL